MDYARILDEAYVAASIAAPVDAPCTGACGFAWVVVDGNDGLARFCRAQIKAAGGERNADRKYGSKGYPRGWQFWKPGAFGGQSVDVHEAGAKAFAAALASHGIRADWSSRLD